MKEIIGRPKLIKEAGVLLIAAIMILSTTAVIANTSQENKENQFALANDINGHSESSRDQIYISYDNEINENAIGLTSGGTFYGAIRLTSEELGAYDDYLAIKIKWHHGSTGSAPPQQPTTGKVYLRGPGTPTSPGTVLYEVDYDPQDVNQWVEVPLPEPYDFDASQDLWVVVRVTHLAGDFPLGVGPGPAVPGKGLWVSTNGVSWDWLPDVSELDGNWNMGAIVFSIEPLEADADGPYEGVVGENIQFEGTVIGGVPPYTYDWDFGNGDHAYVEDPIYNYSAPGVYTVWFNVTDSEMGFASDFTTATITEPEPLVADAHGPYDGLVGEVIHFSGSATGGIPPYTWDWDFGDGNTSDEQNPDYAYSEADVFDVVLTVTDSTQTTDDDATTASVSGKPELNITAIAGGMGVTATIKNVGETAATNLEWNIVVTGGFLGLVDADVDGNKSSLAIDATEDAASGSLGFLHLGGLDITVTADADNADKISKDYTAFIIGPIVISIAEA